MPPADNLILGIRYTLQGALLGGVTLGAVLGTLDPTHIVPYRIAGLCIGAIAVVILNKKFHLTM
jgi:hypothetical protein